MSRTTPSILSNEAHAIIAEQADANFPMTELLRNHYHDIKFDLRLQHKPTGRFVEVDCFSEWPRYALRYESGVKGRSVDFLYRYFKKLAPWLADYDVSDFQVHSTAPCTSSI